MTPGRAALYGLAAGCAPVVAFVVATFTYGAVRDLRRSSAGGVA